MRTKQGTDFVSLLYAKQILTHSEILEGGGELAGGTSVEGFEGWDTGGPRQGDATRTCDSQWHDDHPPCI